MIPQLESLMSAGTRKALRLVQFSEQSCLLKKKKSSKSEHVRVYVLALYTNGKHTAEKMWTLSLNCFSDDIRDTTLPVMHHLRQQRN